MAVNYNIPFQTQLDYMMYELQGPESKTMDAFKSAGSVTPQDYAELFEQKYERAGGKGMDMRKQFALDVFRAAGTDSFKNLPENAQTAFNYFKGKGFTDAQAAGIVGNLMTESYARIDPQAYNPAGGGQGAYGIAQFRGPRLKGLLSFANTLGDQSMDGIPTTTTTMQKPGNGGMLRGLLDYASEKSPDTGLTRFQSFAAALDPLIMPEMRAGTAIRQAGQTRLDQGKVNKTVEWLKKNGYADIAAIVERNPEMAATVMGSIVQEQIRKPGVKVIGDKMVDETGKVLYEGDPEKLKQLDEKQVTVVRNLSNDLLKSYKIYNEVGNGYRLISNAIQNKTGVDDYVLSVAFAKILDPESVVRESEQAAVAKSGGAIDAFVKSVNNFIAGTGSLPEQVRQRIFSTAQTTAKYWYDEAQKEYNRAKRVASYAGIGEDIISDVLPQASPLPEIPPLTIPEDGDGNVEIGANGPVPDDLKEIYTQAEWNRLSAEQVRQLLEASNNNGD